MFRVDLDQSINDDMPYMDIACKDIVAISGPKLTFIEHASGTDRGVLQRLYWINIFFSGGVVIPLCFGTKELADRVTNSLRLLQE